MALKAESADLFSLLENPSISLGQDYGEGDLLDVLNLNFSWEEEQGEDSGVFSGTRGSLSLAPLTDDYSLRSSVALTQELYSPSNRTDSDVVSDSMESDNSERTPDFCPPAPSKLTTKKRKRRDETVEKLLRKIKKLEEENAKLTSQVRVFSHTKCTEKEDETDAFEAIKRDRIKTVKAFTQSLTTGGYEEFEEYLDDVVHDDIVSITSSFGEVRGKEAQKRVVAAWFQACPDFTIIANDAVPLHVSEKGDVQVRLDWTACGTHAGWIGGIRPTKRTLQFSGSTFFTFVGPKVKEAIWVWKDGIFNNPTLKQLIFGMNKIHHAKTGADGGDECIIM